MFGNSSTTSGHLTTPAQTDTMPSARRPGRVSNPFRFPKQGASSGAAASPDLQSTSGSNTATATLQMAPALMLAFAAPDLSVRNPLRHRDRTSPVRIGHLARCKRQMFLPNEVQ